MSKIGYFPGCSLSGTALEYGESIKAICEKLDIELVEINDWNCCGATAAHSLNHKLSISLPARSIALAEQQDFDEILVPCAACYSRLINAFEEVKKDKKLKEEISSIIELPIEAKARPISVLEFLEKYVKGILADKIESKVEVVTACYYGCLLVRPPKLVKIDRYEDPQIMENILKIIGTKTIDWAFKTECCGAGLSVPKTDVVAKLSGDIYSDAEKRGAEAIVLACPMCHSNLDMRRPEIEKYLCKTAQMPVLYITQMIGLALGIPGQKLGLQRHFVPVKEKDLKIVAELA